MRKPLATAVLVVALTASASASAGPIGNGTQAQMKDILDSMGAAALEYVPAYIPSTYALFTTHVATKEFGATFTSTKYKQKSASFTGYAIFFATKFVKGSSCATAARATVKVNGKTVFWNGRDSAWQCVTAPDGQLVAVSAVSAKLGQTELVRVAASATRFR